MTGGWERYAKTQQAKGAAGCAVGAIVGSGSVSQKDECMWRIAWFNKHTAIVYETKQARSGIASAMMAHTKQYIMSHVGLQTMGRDHGVPGKMGDSEEDDDMEVSTG